VIFSLPSLREGRGGQVEPPYQGNFSVTFPTYPPYMRTRLPLLTLLLLGLATSAHADQATVREVARINNCPPKKVTVFQQSLGLQGTTVYQVDCNLPKATDDKQNTPDAVLISCAASLCSMLRPLQTTGK
jgi:hypothetical protein